MRDFKIDESIVKDLDKDGFLWAIVEPIWPSSDEEDTPEFIAQGTPGQQALYAVTLFIREVDNGGLEQFFNNDSGKYTNMVIAGLKLIGANDHLNALNKAIKIFHDSHVPLDRSLRQKVLKTGLKKNNLNDTVYFEEFNDSLYGEERMQDIFMNYIKNNRQDFFKD